MSQNSSITSLGTVKYNAQRDVVETHRRKRRKDGNAVAAPTFTENVSKQDDEFSILPRELCLRWLTPTTKKRMYTDTDVNVFSSANGLFLHKNTLYQSASDDPMEALKSNLAFGGIAATRAVYSSTDRSDDQMVVLFGGTTTIRNTGHEGIRSGDYVQWDLPATRNSKRDWVSKEAPRSRDCRRTKLLFQTKPFRAQDCDLTVKEWTDLKGKLDDADASHETCNALLRRKFYEARRRVFGRALSSAAPGKEFDVLIGRYMA